MTCGCFCVVCQSTCVLYLCIIMAITAVTSALAGFSLRYHEWVRRLTDIEPKVRLAMVKYLVTILQNKGRFSERSFQQLDQDTGK